MRRRYYSRRASTEQRKNTKKATLYIFYTIALVAVIFFFGLPLLAKFAGFLTDLRTSSQPIESVDKTPPPPPRLSDLPDSTNKKSIDISGSTEPGATVTLNLDGDNQDVIANNDGTFSYSFSLKSGNNTISATAKDSSGNVSQKSAVINISYDTTPPDLEVTKPQDGASFYGSRQRQLVIDGKTEDDAQVNINGHLVVVSSDGTFTYLTTLTSGENKFSVKSQDTAGNITEKDFTVSYSE